MTWWDAARIERTVTLEFVTSQLQPGNIETLDEAPGFGDGLTDGTYWDWIEGKAKSIFLILLEIGIPDQIFGVVDHAWDDDDLPFSLGDVERITARKDQKLNWRFWDRQFYYILREIQEGKHMVYEDDEVVPIDVVERRQSATLTQSHYVERVTLPDQPGQVLCRRRLSTSNLSKGTSIEDVLREIKGTRNFRNAHVISYFASYTHLDSVYVLLTSASEHNLKSILTNLPTSFKALPKQDRQICILNWIHCLADGLCYLHGRNRSHGNIKPSYVAFDTEFRALLAHASNSNFDNRTHSSEKTTFNKESYDFAAPEQWFRPANSTHIKTALIAPMSPSAENYTFSINRGASDYSVLHPATPNLDPQAADIFSFGCVILELLGLLFKRSSKSFATHRGAKHKLAGRGGAPCDTSFHKNLGQVESWMASLAKDASKKDEQVFRGIAPALQIVARMLSTAPQDRPTARVVEQQMYRVLTEHCQILEPHCVHQYEGFDLGINHLRIRDNNDGPVPISISMKRQSLSDKALAALSRRKSPDQ